MTATTSHATTLGTPDWTSALCAQTDPALFFPEGHGKKVTNAIEQAKRTCGRCPIREACLEWALDTGQNTGVWGGLSEDERRHLVRVPDASMTVCLNAQSWIEEQLAAQRGVKTIARELGVDDKVLGRAIRRFNDERALDQAGVEVAA